MDTTSLGFNDGVSDAVGDCEGSTVDAASTGSPDGVRLASADGDDEGTSVAVAKLGFADE